MNFFDQVENQRIISVLCDVVADAGGSLQRGEAQLRTARRARISNADVGYFVTMAKSERLIGALRSDSSVLVLNTTAPQS